MVIGNPGFGQILFDLVCLTFPRARKKVQLIQQFRLGDLTLVGTFPIPEQPEFNRRTGTPVPSRDGSMMAADLRMPSVYPATLSEWRVYKLK